MKKLWLTYAWEDNYDNNINFIIQKLDSTSIEVKFDKRCLIPGQRLWQQIGKNIIDPNKCDAWAIVITINSLKSEKCIEELSYALERTLNHHNSTFPIFALLYKVSASELPPALKIRLCINLEDNNWLNQVVAAVNQTTVDMISTTQLSPFVFKEHKTNEGYCLEIKPRIDRISPFAIAVDCFEKESGNVIRGDFGPAGIIPKSHVAFKWIDLKVTLTDGTVCWVWGSDNEINSTTSIYLFYKKRPKRIWYGHQQNLIKHEF